MDSTLHDELPLSSPESSQASSVWSSIPPLNYLQIPSTATAGVHLSLSGPTIIDRDELQLTPSSGLSPSTLQVPPHLRPLRVDSNTCSYWTLPSQDYSESYLEPSFMSVYSTASIDSEYSVYSNPPARRYRLPSFQVMSSSRQVSDLEKEQLIQSLRSHQVNTLVELRRIEKVFAVLGSPEVTEPMTAAWSYYVNSHSLLTELRALTNNYPFSSECLEEAKRRVYCDPLSNRSWNFCWLVLTKIQSERLIPSYAQYEASQPAMWGGQTPSTQGVAQLSEAFETEWGWALGQLLRHWDQPPSR